VTTTGDLGAYLNDATVTEEQLDTTYSLEGATLPNSPSR
jgi:hypothetical protein